MGRGEIPGSDAVPTATRVVELLLVAFFIMGDFFVLLFFIIAPPLFYQSGSFTRPRLLCSSA